MTDPPGTRTGVSGKLLGGGIVTIAGQGIKLIVQAAGLVVLSRLLAPEVFGAFAIMTALLAFGELFRDFGLTLAALQAKELSEDQASILFWTNLAIGVILASSLALFSSPIAALYSQPTIAPALATLSFAFVLLGAQAQYQVRLARSMRFMQLAVADVIGQIVGFGFAITLALSGLGIWALVVQQLSAQGAVLITRMALTRWLPGLPKRGVPIAGFFRYGLGLGGAVLLGYASSNADTYMIGLRFGTSILGLYNRAFQLLSLPVNQILSPLTNVFLPVLARVKDDIQEFNRQLLRIQIVLGSLSVWVFMNAIIAAPQVIELVLGPQWTEAATLFRLLALGGIFQIFSHFTYWVTLAKGLTKELFQCNLVTTIGTVIAIVITSFFSVEAVALAVAVCLALSWPINVLWMRRAAQTDVRGQFLLGSYTIFTGLVPSLVLWVLLPHANGATLVVALLGANLFYAGSTAFIGRMTLRKKCQR